MRIRPERAKDKGFYTIQEAVNAMQHMLDIANPHDNNKWIRDELEQAKKLIKERDYLIARIYKSYRELEFLTVYADQAQENTLYYAVGHTINSKQRQYEVTKIFISKGFIAQTDKKEVIVFFSDESYIKTQVWIDDVVDYKLHPVQEVRERIMRESVPALEVDYSRD